MKTTNTEKTDTKGKEPRILARSLARELTAEETQQISGAYAAVAAMSTSTCGSSDNQSCDLDFHD